MLYRTRFRVSGLGMIPGRLYSPSLRSRSQTTLYALPYTISGSGARDYSWPLLLPVSAVEISDTPFESIDIMYVSSSTPNLVSGLGFRISSGFNTPDCIGNARVTHVWIMHRTLRKENRRNKGLFLRSCGYSTRFHMKRE